MSIKSGHYVWLKIKVDSKRYMNISLPISINAVREILGCFVDLLSTACFFVPNVHKTDSDAQLTVFTMRDFVILVETFIDALTDEGTYDLVDVEADDVNVSIKIR